MITGLRAQLATGSKLMNERSITAAKLITQSAVHLLVVKKALPREMIKIEDLKLKGLALKTMIYHPLPQPANKMYIIMDSRR